MAARAVVHQFRVLCDGLEVDEFEQFRKVDLIAEEVLHLCLPLGLLELLPLYGEPDLVDLAEPLFSCEARLLGQKIAAAQVLKERDGEQGLNRSPAKVTAGGDEGILMRVFHDGAAWE